MATNIAEAIREGLSNNYQLQPEALSLMENLLGRVDLVSLVMKVVELKKTSGDLGGVITKQELEDMLPESEKRITEGEQKVEEVDKVEEEESYILRDPTKEIHPSNGSKGFQNLFENRYEKLMKIVKERYDSYQIQKISELGRIKTQTTKIAGLVLEKKVRRNSVRLTLDDDTGRMSVVAVNEDVKRSIMEISLDQLLVVDVGFTKGGAIVRNAYSPDIPDHTPNVAKKRIYVVFLSDLHIGSKHFLNDYFHRFILWINGNLGDKEIVDRVKYVVLGGDGIDGVGIYPGQEYDLEECNLYIQYRMLSELLEKIPEHINIFIIPGNHDPVRQALPQPAIPESYAQKLYELQNTAILGNPAYLSLSGVKVLVYHGRSLDDVLATTPGLNYSRPAGAMKVLLKARHLAPMYGGRTPIAPGREDLLVIEDVPDIFHAGHVHTIDADMYKGTLMINSGTWQSQTSYQANMGVKPTPALVPIVNLSTLQGMVKDFRSTVAS